MWTWNAIGKAAGAWNLTPDANEAKLGFLLNHVISEELPAGQARISNSDPITGQAAWYDVRVRISKVSPGETAETSPQFAPLHPYPGQEERKSLWAYMKGAVK